MQGSNSTGASSSENTVEEDEPVPYKMSRSVSSVSELWKEFTEGIGINPAVETLESQHGTKWRKGNSETQFYFRRKAVIDRVKHFISSQNLNTEAAIRKADVERGSKSLDAYGKKLKKDGVTNSSPVPAESVAAESVAAE